MKVVLFTPTHRGSAIARVSALLRGAFEADGHGVTVVATEDERIARSDSRVDLADSVDWRDQTAIRDLIWPADLVFHQVGNHFGFHAGSVFWLPRIGGIIALHDVFLGDLFLVWAEHNSAAADEILHHWYDIDIAAFRTVAHSGHFAERAHDAWPLTEWIARNSDAVIAHSLFGLNPVRRATSAPIRELPLPYSLASGGVTAREKRDADPTRTVRLLTFGHIIPNKLCDDIIAAVGADPSVRNHVEYRICGEISDEYRARLTSFADAIGVTTVITGALSDDELSDELARADVIACTRRPTLEGASASAIESLLSATPLIVLDEGFYASLPRDIVFHVDADDFQGALTRALRAIVGGEHDLAARAEAGRAYAEATFRADRYAKAVIALAPAAAEHRLLREVDQTFSSLRLGPPEVAAAYARDTAILRADPPDDPINTT